MKKSTNNTMIFNAAGILVMVTVAGYMAHDATRSNSAPVCSVRFPNTTSFSLSGAGGKPLAPEQLQARSGIREWGLLQNAKVVATGEAGLGNVLEIALHETENDQAGARNGVGFSWRPKGIERAVTTCLTYRIWLPKDFNFGSGGVLPGLYGGDEAVLDSNATAEGLVARLGWTSGGTPEINLRRAGQQAMKMSLTGTTLNRGEWVKIDQEIGLGGENKSDGFVRVWVDGVMAFEETNVAWATPAGQDQKPASKALLDGVAVDVGYEAAAPKPASVRLSPLEVGWN